MRRRWLVVVLDGLGRLDLTLTAIVFANLPAVPGVLLTWDDASPTRRRLSRYSFGTAGHTRNQGGVGTIT